jgi:hypothetical protein
MLRNEQDINEIWMVIWARGAEAQKNRFQSSVFGLFSDRVKMSVSSRIELLEVV